MTAVRRAAPAHAPLIAALGREIWTQHYTPLIGGAQVEYMLSIYQSRQAVLAQMQDGYRYYLAPADAPDGYCAVRPEGDGLFLSKLYVRKSARGRGLARALLAAALAECDLPPRRVTLTVNRGNASSIAAYERMGFHIEGPRVTDIGAGFVMDDYLMAHDAPEKLCDSSMSVAREEQNTDGRAF